MREKSIHARGRGRGAGLLVTLAAMASILVASVGAAPAQAQQTQTAWIPLHCSLVGVFPIHIGASLTATFPDSVAPGDTFELTDVTTQVIFPPVFQQAGIVFIADAIQGIVSDFETNLTNATAAFANTAGGEVVSSSPTQFDTIGAVQPPNRGPTGSARIDGLDPSRGGFQPTTPAETFSFGDVPIDTSGASGNAFGPAPGVGGGFSSGSGTPDLLPPIGPLTVTGAAGDSVRIRNANPGGPEVGGGVPAGNPIIADYTISFHQTPAAGGDYTQQITADCARDVSAQAVPSPNAAWVDQFTVPIVDGVGSVSVRGTDPNATLGASSVAAQISAIINCDEGQSTRPFIVRWTAGSTTYTFTKTSVDTSRCFSNSGFSVNQGNGEGTVNGVHATMGWTLLDGSQVPGPDGIDLSIHPDSGDSLGLGGQLQPLFGTPGGVWVFGTLPWPARP